MNDFRTQLKKELESIRMSHAERTSMREKLAAYREMKPRRPVSQRTAPTVSWFSFMSTRVAVPALIVVLLFGTSGISLAAEGALPGDVLYGVKRNVNESLLSAFAVSEEAELELGTHLAERRLEEATKLASRDELSPEVAAGLAMDIEAHVIQTAEQSESVEENNPALAAEASAELEAVLLAHEAILEELAGTPTRVNESVSSVLAQVGRSLERARAGADVVGAVDFAQSVAMTSSKVSSLAQVVEESAMSEEDGQAPDSEIIPVAFSEEEKAVALRLQHSAYEAFESMAKLLAAANGASAKRRTERALPVVDYVKEVLTQGDAQIERGEYGNATQTFRSTLFLTKRVDVYVRVGGNLDIDLSPGAYERGEQLRRERNERSSGMDLDNAAGNADTSVDPIPRESSAGEERNDTGTEASLDVDVFTPPVQ